MSAPDAGEKTRKGRAEKEGPCVVCGAQTKDQVPRQADGKRMAFRCADLEACARRRAARRKRGRR